MVFILICQAAMLGSTNSETGDIIVRCHVAVFCQQMNLLLYLWYNKGLVAVGLAKT